jgi:glycosyltransferase involved in cell wall biosynthesis
MSFWPLITVVTPSYNQADYLQVAIESVLSQHYPSLEYIVMDGGSTDGTLEVIHRYSDQITYWKSEPDAGQADAINKGFARSRGEIVAFLNSDDFYFPGALFRVAEAFMSHPSVGVVYGYGRFVAHDGQPIRDVGGAFSAKDMIDGVYPALPQPAVFLRQAVIEKVGGLDTSLHYALDGEFFWRAFANFDALFIPEVLAALRLQPRSKSVSSGTSFAPEILRIAEKVISEPDSYPRFTVAPKHVRAAAHLNSSRFLYNNGQYGAALRSLAASVRLSRRYSLTILTREIPRLIAHAMLGKPLYERLGASCHPLAKRLENK